MKSTHDEAARLLESWRQANADLRCAFDDKSWSFSCSGRISSTAPVVKLRGQGFEAMLNLVDAEIEYEYYDLDEEGAGNHGAPGEHTVSLTVTLPNSVRVHMVGRQMADPLAESSRLHLGLEH